jgi:sec-independent protein translocase protein TatB
MFDIGFWEICLVALVSLIVIGPEKLPKAARVAGFWVGKSRNMVASVKAEIKEELQAEEMRQILIQQSGVEEVQKMLDEGTDTVNDITSSIKNLAKQTNKQSDESN